MLRRQRRKGDVLVKIVAVYHQHRGLTAVIKTANTNTARYLFTIPEIPSLRPVRSRSRPSLPVSPSRYFVPFAARLS